MAAVAQSPFGLQPPAADDTMEISSNFGGDMDPDIDIDFDSVGEQMQYDEDDQMIDDAKPENMHYQDHVDEDVMVDDDATTNPEDKVMQDSPPPHQEYDEELLDFSDNEDIHIENADHAAPDDTISDTQSQHLDSLEQVQSDAAAELLAEAVEPVTHSAHTVESDLLKVQPEQHVSPVTKPSLPQIEDDLVKDRRGSNDAQPDITAPESHPPQSPPQSEELAQDKYDQVPLQSPSQQHVSQSVEDSQVHTDGLAEQPTVQASEIQEVQDDAADQDPADPVVTDALEGSHPQPAPLRVDTELSQVEEPEDVTTRERQPNSPTVTGLHPTIVEYDGNEIFLFPSREPASFEQYLLENENLVTSSLGDLLQACRVVLGESISEDEELVLGVEELDLYVSEDSTPAFSTSFSELLDAYVKLHQHDGNDQPPAFRVTLTTKTRFTNRLTTITQAIAEGKGFSQLAFLQAYNEYEGVTELPDPDEDFDEENYLDVDENHSQVQEPQEDNEITQESVDNGNLNGPAQQEGSDATLASGQAEIEAQSDDHGGLDHTGVDEYQMGEYARKVAAGQPDHVNEAGYNHETESSKEETQTLDAEGDYHSDAAAADGRVVQQESAEGQLNAVTESITDIDGEDYLLDYSEDDDCLTTTITAALSNPQLQSTQLDDTSASRTSGETFTGITEEAAYQSNEHEDNLFDGEADEVYGNTGHASAVLETTASTGNSNSGLANPFTHPTSTSLQDNEVPGSGEYDHSFEDEFEDGPMITPEQPTSVPVASKDLTTLDNSPGDNDFDEIDFDDDDDYVNEHPSVNTNTDAEPAKLSPPGKRSFSDRATEGEIDEDSQALKKIRSS